MRSRTILIVSASIGAGHNQAANAIKAAWRIRYPNDSVYVVDFVADNSSYFNHFVKDAYLKTIAITPDLYETLYRWTQATVVGGKVQDILSWSMRRSMERLIKKYRPEVVVCTHPFPCGAMAYLKRKINLRVPIVGVVTDFAVHPIWLNQGVNQYIVAASELKTDLMKLGIPSHRISDTGIPIHPSFADVERDRNRTSHKTDLTILIMGGGLGLGPMQELLSGLNQVDSPLEIITVTGNNADLRKDLETLAEHSKHNVKVLGFTEHIRELMSISDVLITKPGALTISEALAMELPLLFYEAIPGQELDNATFVIKKGAARWLTNSEKSTNIAEEGINNVLNDLLNDREGLVKMKAAAREIKTPRAALLSVDSINRIVEHNDFANKYMKKEVQ